MKKLLFSIIIVVFIFQACLTIQLPPVKPGELDKYKQEGSCKITGEFFLRTMGGDIKSGAGKNVFLYPDIQHVRTYMQSIGRGKLPNMNYEVINVRKTTICDMDGKFCFENIPQGKYIVAGDLYWAIPGQVLETGATVYKFIEIKDGESVNVLLTK